MKSLTPVCKSAPPEILVVDDEQIVLVSLRETLRQLGYTVWTASDAVEGISLLQRQRFAVVITDQQMPRLTGLEFLAHVRQLQPNATRVLITAVLSLGTVIDAINRAEIFRFLLKPWLREDLLITVRCAVERYEALERERELMHTLRLENDVLGRRVQTLEGSLAPGIPAAAAPQLQGA